MGKLAIISDLHVDINKLAEPEINQLINVLKNNKVTHLHIAGDTANTTKKVIETVNQIETANIPMTFNFGNHELADIKEPRLMEEFLDERFLNLKTYPLTEKLVLIGVNGWYDYSFAIEEDHKKIVAAKNLFWYDRLIERGATDPEIMGIILIELKRLLDELKKENKEVIIATHFVPKREFVHYHTGEYERWNQINAFLGSDAFGDLIDGYDHVKQVVFGHTHRQFPDTLINGTIYTAKPFGYFYEWQLTREFMLSNHLMTNFNPLRVRKLLKGHEAEFESFKQMMLSTEFTNKLTFIDY
ncbi:metallophosphoesterase [Vagococcus fluvialis]|uniref:metallophosphoesterase n=1 Tax=Vagococcus fluvialis TaxID=2738 RepID=UPI0037976718